MSAPTTVPSICSPSMSTATRVPAANGSARGRDRSLRGDWVRGVECGTEVVGESLRDRETERHLQITDRADRGVAADLEVHDTVDDVLREQAAAVSAGAELPRAGAGLDGPFERVVGDIEGHGLLLVDEDREGVADHPRRVDDASGGRGDEVRVAVGPAG